MKKIGKMRGRPFGRSLTSFILILTILLGLFPATAFAAETMTVSSPDSLEQIGEIEIEGSTYILYHLEVDTAQYNEIKFSPAASCSITTVVPIIGQKPGDIGATNLVTVAPDLESYSKGETLYTSTILPNLSDGVSDKLGADTDKLL